jgi:hypothetical protein
MTILLQKCTSENGKSRVFDLPQPLLAKEEGFKSPLNKGRFRGVIKKLRKYRK